jgi:hypothetical protein
MKSPYSTCVLGNEIAFSKEQPQSVYSNIYRKLWGVLAVSCLLLMVIWLPRIETLIIYFCLCGVLMLVFMLTGKGSDLDRFRGLVRVKNRISFFALDDGFNQILVDGVKIEGPQGCRLVQMRWGAMQSNGASSLPVQELLLVVNKMAFAINSTTNEKEMLGLIELFREKLRHRIKVDEVVGGAWSNSYYMTFLLPFVVALWVAGSFVVPVYMLKMGQMFRGVFVVNFLSGLLMLHLFLFFTHSIAAYEAPRMLKKSLGDVKPVYQAFWINPWLAFLLAVAAQVTYYFLCIREPLGLILSRG